MVTCFCSFWYEIINFSSTSLRMLVINLNFLFLLFLKTCILFVTQCRPWFSQLMHHPSTCTDEWRPTASTLCLLSLPCKRAGGKSQLRSKRSSNEPFLENFLTTGSYFELYMYRVMGWRRRKKMNKSESLLFQVCHFKIVTTHCYYYCRLGQAL